MVPKLFRNCINTYTHTQSWCGLHWMDVGRQSCNKFQRVNLEKGFHNQNHPLPFAVAMLKDYRMDPSIHVAAKVYIVSSTTLCTYFVYNLSKEEEPMPKKLIAINSVWLVVTPYGLNLFTTNLTPLLRPLLLASVRKQAREVERWGGRYFPVNVN